MIQFLLLLLTVTVVAGLGRRAPSPPIRRLSYFVVGGVLVLFAGLRDSRVGTDTAAYVSYFDNAHSLSAALENDEVAYYLLSWLARSLSDSYAVLLITIAFIVVACYVSTIVRLVRRYETAIYLFLALGAYTFLFNGARQAIAAALCFAAIPYLLERRLWPYIALVLLAAAFHRTALIALPLYWLASAQLRSTRIAALFFSVLVAAVFLKTFVGVAAEFLNDRYAMYGEAGEGGGEVLVAFLLAQGVVLYRLRKFAGDDERFTRLLNLYLIGLVPAVVSTISSVDPSGLIRLHFYFSHSALVLWPMVFAGLRMHRGRELVGVGFLAVTLVFYFLTTSAFGEIVPYRLNKDLFPS